MLGYMFAFLLWLFCFGLAFRWVWSKWLRDFLEKEFNESKEKKEETPKDESKEIRQ